MSSNPFFLADAETERVLASWRITDPATLKDVKRQLRQTRRFAQERAHEIAMGY